MKIDDCVVFFFFGSTFAPEVSAIVGLHARYCVTIPCYTPAHGLYGRVSDNSNYRPDFLEGIQCSR
jgi:hypothetical protein